MAGSKSDYLENKLLDHVLGNTAFSAPATVYLALYTVAPTDAGGGTEVGTGTWTNYARLAVTNNTTNWPNASAGSKSLGVTQAWPTVTASGSVTVVAVGIFDALTTGNLLYWSSFTGVVVANGDTVQFANGNLTVTED